jgi:hypothetical protein
MCVKTWNAKKWWETSFFRYYWWVLLFSCVFMFLTTLSPHLFHAISSFQSHTFRGTFHLKSSTPLARDPSTSWYPSALNRSFSRHNTTVANTRQLTHPLFFELSMALTAQLLLSHVQDQTRYSPNHSLRLLRSPSSSRPRFSYTYHISTTLLISLHTTLHDGLRLITRIHDFYNRHAGCNQTRR